MSGLGAAGSRPFRAGCRSGAWRAGPQQMAALLLHGDVEAQRTHVDVPLAFHLALDPQLADDRGMNARAWPRIEPLALIAATLATAMAACYVWLSHQQGDQPLPWVLALLLAGALLAAYGAIGQLPCRHAALLAAGAALTTLGLLALPSIGLPIIASGFLALASTLRSPQRRAP
jgi:hypothetical protein